MSFFQSAPFPVSPFASMGRPEYRKPLAPEDEDGVAKKLLGHSTSLLQTGLDVLDTPGALVRGGIGKVIGARPSGSRTSGRDLTNAIGLTRIGDQSWLASGLGLGAELLTDPLSYLSFGTSAALTKPGQALAKSGALKGWSRAQKVMGFDALESGLSAAGHSASDIRHAREAGRKIARSSDEAAVAAAGGRLQANQPLAGLVGVGLPFGAPKAVFGTGPAAAKVAGALDDIGGKLRYGTTAGRWAGALFDSKVREATGPATQRAMREAGSPAFEDATRRARGETFDVIHALDGPIRAGVPEADLLRSARQAGEGVPLRPAPFTGPLDPGIPGAASHVGQLARDVERRQLDEAARLGLPLQDAADKYASYIPRMGLDVAAAKSQATGSPVARVGLAPRIDRGRLASVESAGIARDEAWRNVPGGTTKINDWATTLGGNPQGLAPSALARTIRRDMISEVLAGGLPITPALRRELKGKALEIAPRIASLPPEHAAHKIGLFSDDLAGAVERSGRSHANAVANANAVHALIGNEARPRSVLGIDSVPVGKLLSDLNMVTHDADAVTGQPLRGALVQAYRQLARHGAGKVDGFLSGKADALRRAVDDYAVPRSVYDEVVKAHKGWAAPSVVAEPLGLFGNLTSTFKAAVYPAFPASHFKNALGAAVVNAGDGIGPAAHALQVKLMRNTATAADLRRFVPDIPAGLPDPEARDWVRRQQFVHAEIGGGSTGALDLENSASKLQARTSGRLTPDLPGDGFTGGGSLAGDTAKLIGGGIANQFKAFGDKIRHPLTASNPFEMAGVFGGLKDNPALATGRKVGEAIEATARGANWLGHRQAGLSPEEAGRAVIAGHYDYSALSAFERNVMKQVFPFYSFTRFNSPARIAELIHRPAVPVAQLRAINAARDDGNGYFPEYLRGTSAIPLGPEVAGKRSFLTSLGLPIEESFGRLRFRDGIPDAIGTARANLSGLNPLLRSPLELLTGKQLATGRDLSDIPPSGAATALGRLVGDERPTSLSAILSATPASRLLSTFDRLGSDRVGLPSKLSGLLTGIGATEVDVDRARDADARRAVLDTLSSSPRVSRHIGVSVPKSQAGNLTAEEVESLRALASIQARGRERAAVEARGGPIGIAPRPFP